MKQEKTYSFYVVSATLSQTNFWYLWTLSIWILALHPVKERDNITECRQEKQEQNKALNVKILNQNFQTVMTLLCDCLG